MRLNLSDSEILSIKIATVEAYSRLFNRPIGSVADSFYAKGIFDYISENAPLFATKRAEFAAESVNEVFGDII